MNENNVDAARRGGGAIVRARQVRGDAEERQAFEALDDAFARHSSGAAEEPQPEEVQPAGDGDGDGDSEATEGDGNSHDPSYFEKMPHNILERVHGRAYDVGGVVRIWQEGGDGRGRLFCSLHQKRADNCSHKLCRSATPRKRRRLN